MAYSMPSHALLGQIEEGCVPIIEPTFRSSFEYRSARLATTVATTRSTYMTFDMTLDKRHAQDIALVHAPSAHEPKHAPKHDPKQEPIGAAAARMVRGGERDGSPGVDSLR